MPADAVDPHLRMTAAASPARATSERRPKVLIVGQGPPTTGGIPTFVTLLSQDAWLIERADVRLLNTTPRGTKLPGSLSLSNLWFAASDATRVFFLGRQHDVVHLNLAATPMLPLVRAMLLCFSGRAAGCAVVLHLHTGEIPACLERRRYRRLFRLVMRLVDVMIVVSRDAEKAVRALGGEVVRMENGVPVASYEVGPKEEPPLITFVGTVCERKGVVELHDALLEVRQELPQLPFRLLIVGDSKQEGPGVFQRMRRLYDDVDFDVKFTGSVDPAMVRDILSRSSMFCLPSYSEGFPIALLEAMAAGAAIIASNVGDVASMLDGGAAGVLVPPRVTGALADAVSNLLLHPDQRESLGQRARARAEDQYDLRETVTRVHELYTTCVTTSEGVVAGRNRSDRR